MKKIQRMKTEEIRQTKFLNQNTGAEEILQRVKEQVGGKTTCIPYLGLYGTIIARYFCCSCHQKSSDYFERICVFRQNCSCIRSGRGKKSSILIIKY